MSRMQVLALAGALSVLGTHVFAGPCGDRIAQMEKSTAAQPGGGASATGSTGTSSAANDQPGSRAVEATSTESRLPANRPATSDSAAAQVQGSASDRSSASGQGTENRIPAKRPPSPDEQAAEVQAQKSASASGSAQGGSNLGDVLREAKQLDQQGREADCMQALSKAGSGRQ